jgi:hypothetical protein
MPRYSSRHLTRWIFELKQNVGNYLQKFLNHDDWEEATGGVDRLITPEERERIKKVKEEREE